MKKLTLPAKIESIEEATAFVDEQLESAGCSPKTVNKINVVIDELFGNIARYAYPEGDGDVTVSVETDGDAAKIVFSDHGIAFDPLEKEEPDITKSAEEREIGGLGIFMVRRIMDSVSYTRKDGENILTVIKKTD